MRIVDGRDGPFLVRWHYDDIRAEAYGAPSLRPMVIFQDPYDTIEKGLWCHLNGMTHLGGERNIDIALATGVKFEIDSLITDGASLHLLHPLLKKRGMLSTISVIDSAFDAVALMSFSAYAERVRLVLALPEIGAFAEASLAPQPIFVPLPGCIIEKNETLILTKERALMTPVVRYDTGIRAAEVSVR